MNILTEVPTAAYTTELSSAKHDILSTCTDPGWTETRDRQFKYLPHHGIVSGLTYKHQLQLLTLIDEGRTHEHTITSKYRYAVCVLTLYTWNALPTDVARKACLPLTLRAKGTWLLHKPSALKGVKTLLVAPPQDVAKY